MNTSKTLLAILAEELPKRGGWPEGALNVTQDNDGEVSFSGSGTPEFGYAAWHHSSGGSWSNHDSWFYCETATDHTTAIITRDQYEAALAEGLPEKLEAQRNLTKSPAADPDSWIEWHGGECPVDFGTPVDVKILRDSAERVLTAVIPFSDAESIMDVAWNQPAKGWQILAYRLHQPQDANSRANDDRLAQHAAAHAGFASTSRDEETDLNDCIGQAPEDITLLTHFMLDEIRDSEINIRLDDAYELAQHLISVGYRKQ